MKKQVDASFYTTSRDITRVPGTDLDQGRSTWVLMHGDLRRVQRVRLFVDFLYESLLERRADFIG